MTVAVTNAPALSTRPVTPTDRVGGSGLDSAQLEAQLLQLDRQARAAAECGEVSEAARLILKAMDCERRLASRGPQILQLIKPRG